MVVTHGGNADVTNGGSELDKRVGFVVLVRRASFAASTEVQIVTDGALVAISSDVGLDSISIFAKWAITEDTVVTNLAGQYSAQAGTVIKWFVDWHKSVARMDEVGIGNAAVAEIPIRTV